MTTEETRVRCEAGFSLVEVLVAMLIMAVGMLSLIPLGVGAARSIALADQQSEVAMLGSAVMEARMQEVRSAPQSVSTSETCEDHPGSGYEVCSRIATRATLPSLPGGAARVSVWIAGEPGLPPQLDLVSHVYDSRLP